MRFETPFGPAWAEIDENNAVTAFGFGERRTAAGGENAEVARQVAEYFAGVRQVFDVPLAPKGTEFQQRVWAELVRIPFGSTVTYTGLSERCGIGKAPRAAGRANATNPISLLIPCHRVVGSKGELTGYAHGIDLKKKLLDFEKGIATAAFREAS